MNAHPIPAAAVPTGAEAALAARVAATPAGSPLLVQGNATKLGMLRPVQGAAVLSTRDDAGITLYAPKELILSARAGTPLPDIQAALAEQGQHLIAEPPDLRHLYGIEDRPQTIGGVVATNLSGPRRVAWGAMRDHVMGIRAVTGHGELIHSGGRVLKNVTGLDLCKLYTGSHGTLGVITEVTVKVLPAPQTTGTLVIPAATAEAGVRLLSAALGSPYSVSAAAWLPGPAAARAGFATAVALARIEDFAASVAYRTDKLRAELGQGGDILPDAASRAAWAAIGDVRVLPAAPDQAIWRVSVRPSQGPGVLAAVTPLGIDGFLDWGGGLVWLAGPATEAAHLAVERAVERIGGGGTWTLMRGPDALRAAVRVVPPELAPLARIMRRVKDALDPRGIMTPSRLIAGI